MLNKKQMLNQMHNIHRRNTHDVGKQWVKSWGMYRWAGEACTYVKEVSNNRVYEEESDALKHNISLRKQKQVARAEKIVYQQISWRSNTKTHGPSWVEYHEWMNVCPTMHRRHQMRLKIQGYKQVTVCSAANINPIIVGYVKNNISSINEWFH